jgi:hypothetical protein
MANATMVRAGSYGRLEAPEPYWALLEYHLFCFVVGRYRLLYYQEMP